MVSELAALRTYVSREFYYTMTDLIGAHGWKHIETFDLLSASGSWKEHVLRRFGELPEVILFWGGYELLGPHRAQLESLACLKCAFVDDLHSWDVASHQQKSEGLSTCDVILAAYAYALDEFHPGLAETKKVIWIPHSASPDFMLDYNEHPANGIFLSGAMDSLYPLRCRMKSLHDQGVYPIVFQPHPGYACGYDYAGDHRVGKSYARSINRMRAAFTDCLRYRYVVAKYFEIPATGALLLAEGAVSDFLARLGFVAGAHYIAVSSETLEEMIRYVLDEANHSEVDAIRRRGQELVRRSHKASDRARMIDDALSS